MVIEIRDNRRFFEDLQEGEVHHFGPIVVTVEDILWFGHFISETPVERNPSEAADLVGYKNDTASWLAACMTMRLFVDSYLNQLNNLGSPGIDEFSWLEPVCPNDELSIQVTTLTMQASHLDRGIVKSRIDAFNQNGKKVLTFILVNFIGRRPNDIHASG